MTARPARRILHTADLHIAFLGDKGCQSLEAVVNTAIKSRADLLLIAGDLFDVVLGGAVKINLGREDPLAEAAAAHRDLEGRKTTGSTLLVP